MSHFTASLKTFVERLSIATRDDIEQGLTIARDLGNDFGQPAEARRHYKDMATLLRKELKRFAPRRRNPTTKKKTATKKKTTRRKSAASATAAGADRRRRFEYRCALKRGSKPAGVRNFWAVSDKAALDYANGLMLNKLPNGTKPGSLKRTGKSRVGPARAAKKKVTRVRGVGLAQ